MAQISMLEGTINKLNTDLEGLKSDTAALRKVRSRDPIM